MASIFFDVLQHGDGAHECGGAAGAAAQLGQLPLALEGGPGRVLDRQAKDQLADACRGSTGGRHGGLLGRSTAGQPGRDASAAAWRRDEERRPSRPRSSRDSAAGSIRSAGCSRGRETVGAAPQARAATPRSQCPCRHRPARAKRPARAHAATPGRPSRQPRQHLGAQKRSARTSTSTNSQLRTQIEVFGTPPVQTVAVARHAGI
jgi:hypothetical protein